jgi:hypothetical protein
MAVLGSSGNYGKVLPGNRNTVFAFGDFSLSVQRFESHCRDDVSGCKALDEIRRMLSGLRRKVPGDDDQEKA